MIRKKLSVIVLLAALMVLLAASMSTMAANGHPVFINEIHYDNSGTDTGEAIEIAGPAGTDLTGWSLVRYNGNGGFEYGTDALGGSIPDLGGGYGVVVVTYPSNGLQNGSPDGVALVDAGSNVVQFLSYEGTFGATEGPASGMTSTDIGVSEASGTLVGDSLQLTGTGTLYEDFTWSSDLPDTFGAVNTGQTFGTVNGPTDPVINEFVANHTGADSEAFVELFGDPSTDYSAFTILEIEGDSSGAGVIDAVLPVGTTSASGYWIDDEDMENGTITILLVQNFSGALGDDLDTDNDGSLDATPWDAVVDDVATTDGGSSDRTYSATVLAPFFDGSPFGAGGASRIPNATDTNAVSDWVRNDFDGFGFPGFVGSPAIGEAENTPDAVNAVISVPTDPIGVCGDPATLIHDIQGSGLTSGDVGSIREVEAVVVATFYGPNQIGGYFVQEEDTDVDGNPLTSEGLRVFDTSNTPDVGDVVRIRGSVAEFFGLTELTNVTNFAVCGSGVATAASINLPVNSIDDFEAYEGMLVTFPQTLYISEFFNFDRFGEIVLTTDRQFQPTATYEPGSPEAAQLALDNQLSRIKLDDARGNQNPDPALHPNGSEFDLSNLFRGGDTLDNVTGVLDYNFGEYKIQLTQGADYTNANPRTEQPDDVGGNLKVAAFNVLNYFTTLDYPSGHPLDNMCGPLQNQGCRGADADQPDEFTRQRDKIIAALAAIDADVVGLIEIENHPGDVPTADLVSGLNAVMGEGTYEYIATGAIGSDAIRQAFIYKPSTVSLEGGYAVLDDPSFTDPLGYGDEKSRPALAQTFMDNETGGVFTVVVNHLKSKGSPCGPGDDDPEAGSCNLTRELGAQALIDWLATDPTGSGDGDVLVIGDLNSYDKEDPIDVLVAGGYTDLLFNDGGEFAYSYVFDGQLGYLDYGMANQALLPEVTGVTAWHINTDEPDIIDYDTSFKKDAQDALYEPNAYRSSDHDPVIVGLDTCDEIAPTLEVSVTPKTLRPANHKYVEVKATVTAADNFDPNPSIELVSVTSNEPDNGDDDGNTVNDIVVVDDYTFNLRAERSGIGTGRLYTITYRVTDACGNMTEQSATVSVPLIQGKLLVQIQLLAFNDYHGHLQASTPGTVDGNPAGGGEFLSAKLNELRTGNKNSLTVAAGDLIGGSPAFSGLFHDEPSVESLNAMHLDVSSVGNHEFDEGVTELLRMQNGGCHPVDGCYFPDSPYAGANFQWLAANVVNETTNETPLPPYWITEFESVKVAFIGMTLEATDTLVAAVGIQGWDFLDEAETANALVPILQAQGVEAIIVLLHEGGSQTPPPGAVDACVGISGPIVAINDALDPAIDVLITGHTHLPYNCVLPDSDGQPRIVTSAYSFGRVVSEFDLVLDKRTNDVRRDLSEATNHVVVQAELDPDPAITKVLEKWQPLFDASGNTPVGTITADINRGGTPPGSDRGVESPAGNLVADAQLWATSASGAQIAFMNPGGVRTDLTFAESAGEGDGVVTFGEAFTFQPFGNTLFTFPMTGAEILSVLQEQCQPAGTSRPFLHLGVSNGFTYDLQKTIVSGTCTSITISNVMVNGVPLDPAASYMVTANNFLADGGDNFTTFGTITAPRLDGGNDLLALINYLGTFSPVDPPPTDRVNELP